LTSQFAVHNPHFQDRFQGCLVGLAVGDALGGPLEFMSADNIVAQYGAPVREMVGGGWLHLRPGEYTDDTQMTLCIAESIVERETFDMADVARRFVAWYDSRPKDIGNITRLALAELKRGSPWQEAGHLAHQQTGGRSAGNGSIMRCAPVALYRWRDYQQLMADSVDSSRATHWDDLACYGAAALNLIIAELLQGRRQGAVQVAIKMLGGAAPAVTRRLAEVEQKTKADLKPTGFVLDTLETAVWCWQHAGTFEEALVTAVNLGGDADTIGAVCGSLAGADLGLAGIPSRWLDALERWAHLVYLARELHRLSIEGSNP
jgi:ADP-ribosyl-[dinitrogen reductase] hydrolase